MDIENNQLRTKPQHSKGADTVDAIVEAAVLILEERAGDLNMVTTQALAMKSGYSVGSLYRYFRNKDHLFSKIWLHFTSRLHGSVVSKINAFPETGNVRQFMMLIVGHYFDDLSKRNSKRMVLIFRLCIRSLPEPENIAKPIDVLIEPIMRVQKRNQSGTMKIMDENELRTYLRGAIAMVRSDFLEQNAYFGTHDHRRTVLDALVCLFQK